MALYKGREVNFVRFVTQEEPTVQIQEDNFEYSNVKLSEVRFTPEERDSLFGKDAEYLQPVQLIDEDTPRPENWDKVHGKPQKTQNKNSQQETRLVTEPKTSNEVKASKKDQSRWNLK